MEATVSEVHGYPLRPYGFSEPLFLTNFHKKEIAEHLASSGWLHRASEASSRMKGVDEPVEISCSEHRGGRRVEIRRSARRSASSLAWRRGSWVLRNVQCVVDRWREVEGWWSGGEYRDRLVYRVSLDGGAIVDLSLDRASRRWTIIGVVD